MLFTRESSLWGIKKIKKDKKIEKIKKQLTPETSGGPGGPQDSADRFPKRIPLDRHGCGGQQQCCRLGFQLKTMLFTRESSLWGIKNIKKIKKIKKQLTPALF